MNDYFEGHDNASETDSPDKKRLRITRAWYSIKKKKKVKCHFKPGESCANCISYGKECQFNDGAKKRGPPKGYIDALEKRIQKIEHALTSSPTLHEQQQHDIHSPTSSIHKPDTIKKPQGSTTDKVQYLGDMSSFQFFSNKIHLDGKNNNAHWKGQQIRKFGNQVVLIEDGQDQEENPIIMPSIKSIHHWIYSATGADRHTSDRLLKIYFANVHPVLPVVNKTRFLQQYRDQADSYPPSDLLNAMFGAAARFIECESLRQKNKSNKPPDEVWEVPEGWSDHFFDQAQLIITSSAAIATISKVQSIILIHNHSGNLDSKSSACWLLGGLAIRLAQGLGLNRDCEEWDIPESEKQTRKRIWWSLYVADRFHSSSLGRPISIRDEDNDVGYPDATASWTEILDIPETDQDDVLPRFPSAMCKPSNVADGKRVGIYELFIQLVKLSEILGRILQGLYTPKARKVGLEQGSDAIVTQLDHELTEWRFGFPKALQDAEFEDFDESRGYLAPVTASVLLCYFSLLILLHRPFIEAVANGKKARPSYSSFRIGTSAATRGIRIASQMTMRDFMMFPYSFSLYPVLQCCLIHMYNTKNPDARLSTPAKTDLAKGIALISKLRTMSTTAQRLCSLLKTIMNNRDIDVNEEKLRSRDSSADGMPTKVSDVGRGHQRTNSRMNSVVSTSSNNSVEPLNNAFIKPFQQTLSEVIIPPSMEEQSPSPTSMAEAFSLKQFGFNNTLGDPNQFDYIMQDVSTFSKVETLPPMPYMPPMMNGMQPSFVDTSGEGQFRNNPNNPFFSIPSSMDWTEWNEWNQNNQGNSTWQTL
ncbi:hypothetical protein K501DRAFT_275782 [Backusella circina FSU 941]|nr:hypothetical protein K501DRAFT_275782 [Backusella circina FSU 941]